MSLPKFLTRESLYSLATFVSAFLLFQIEPIAGKKLLPYLGGGASVWATALLFFMIVLFVGYAYVYLLTRFSARVQGLVHGAVLTLATLDVLVAMSLHGTLFADLPTLTMSTWPPAIKALVALLESVGFPFFALSTTGPLVQYFFAHERKQEPYHLYALSNAGSLAALLTFPFIFEPVFTLKATIWLWSLGFLFAAAVVLYLSSTYKAPAQSVVPADMRADFTAKAPSRITPSNALAVIVFTTIASFALVAITTALTHQVAPVPLLWILPLSLYLISFIVTFKNSSTVNAAAYVLVFAFTTYYANNQGYSWMALQLLSYSALLFALCIVCHKRVYELRPQKSALPLFYVLVSFGGMLGAFFGSIVPPLLFKGQWEATIALFLAAAVGVWLLPYKFYPRLMTDEHILTTRIIATVALAWSLVSMLQVDPGMYIYRSRNFYGTAKVSANEHTVWLYHDNTLHGLQLKDNEMEPSSYYTPKSGIGRALTYERTLHPTGLHVGVIGLGTGSVAAYCKPGDTFTFYEIDKRIEDVARTYFTYLKNCTGSSVRLGDARLVMEAERTTGTLGAYDLLAVDAFNDDTVPVHLLTQEAIALYKAHMRSEQSILAVHASSRYLQLLPLVERLAKEEGLTVLAVSNGSNDGGYASLWILLSPQKAVFDHELFRDAEREESGEAGPLWTDDFTNVFSVVKLPTTLSDMQIKKTKVQFANIQFFKIVQPYLPL